MKRILLTAALLGASATALMAAGPRADLNDDGQVTKAEFTAIAAENFTLADTDADGFLTEAEVKGMHEARRAAHEGQRFAKLDANGDGVISQEEMSAANDARRDKRSERRDAKKAEMLERFDTNVDGELSETERQAARAERKGERGERRKDRSEKRKTRRADRPQPDANGDGLVSLEEHMAVSEQLFLRMDANGDGVLTKGEGKKRKKRGDRRGR